jgi:preprotein translocase subunit SecB
LESLAEDGRSLSVRVRASILFRLSDEETWQAHVVLLGNFTSTVEVKPDAAELFAKASGLYVLWPYARAYLDQLARISGIAAAPQLPLIVRPGPTPVPAPERPRP